MSVDTILSLVFINKNSRISPPEKYIDLFELSMDNIKDQIDDIEIRFD